MAAPTGPQTADDEVFRGDLCDICSAIPFKDMYWDNREYDFDIPRFGTLLDVRARQPCPFCRLILAGAYDSRVPSRFGTQFWEKEDIGFSYSAGGSHFASRALPLGSRISFLNHPDPGRAFENGRPRLIEGSSIHPGLVETWVEACRLHHQADCWEPFPDEQDDLAVFRLIDVARECIVPGTVRQKYLALSYVWGQVETCRLLRSNKDLLMAPGGLRKVWHTIPQTIRDAIELTSALNEQYLWVDSLCLIQDDRDDVMAGVVRMDLVYERSHLTIVAASGTDAQGGLPGAGHTPRKAKQLISEVSPGVKMVLTHEMEALLKGTRYNERAWTFQEFYLSRRQLIFLNNQVYYSCRFKSWAEDVTPNLESIWKEHDTETLLSLTKDEAACDVYEALSNILFYYTSRQMTHQSDALNAMDGICRRFSIRGKCKFFQGMPVAAFDLYLLFDVVKPLERRPGFPSYSWAGWKGNIVYTHFAGFAEEKNTWLAQQTWIIWYRREPPGYTPTLVWDLAENPAFLDATDADMGYRSRTSFAERYAADVPVDSSQTKPVASPQTALPYPLLQFWTVSTWFGAALDHDHKYGPLCFAEIFDKHGEYCGFLRLDSFPTNELSGGSDTLELIILSEHWDPRMQPWIRQDRVNADIYPEVSAFWALWVEWEDGIAERRGIAQILKAALKESHAPGPVWKEIILG